MSNMLMPTAWAGTPADINDVDLKWIKNFSKNTYCALWLQWPSNVNFNLPLGFECYIVSFYLEAIDIQWLEKQTQFINAPIILLSDNNYYNWPVPTNVFPYTYYSWHYQLDKIKSWFPGPYAKDIKYKVSALTNRISQSKLVVFTKLAETIEFNDCLLKLGTSLDEKSVHYRQPTGNVIIDRLTDVFFKKYYGTEIRIDEFNNVDNCQRYTSDPGTPAYQNCALHFTNESFHYSHYESRDQKFTYPGPFLTEKTLKCLLGETAFIPVGQFDTYNTLEKLGFKFDYKFSTKWDSDPRNLNRLEEIIKLIDQISFFTANELFEFTRESSAHNRDHVMSNAFWDRCQTNNESAIGEIIQKFC